MNSAVPRRRSSGLVFTGTVIGISFVTFLIPLAIYHLAQIAAVKGLKSAFKLYAMVILLLFVLGILGGAVFFLGAGSAVMWAPCIALALLIRQRHWHWMYAVFALSLPSLLLLFLFLRMPVVTDFIGFIDSWKSQFLAQLQQNNLSQGHEIWTQFFQQLESGPASAWMSEVLSLNIWQRLVWLVLGHGAASAVTLIGTSISGVILIDLAFEKISEIKNVLVYVRQHAQNFPAEIVSLGDALANDNRASNSSVSEVKSHQLIEAEGWKSFIVRPKVNAATYFGYRFFGMQIKGWNLSNLQLPLALPVAAVLALGYLFYSWRDDIYTHVTAFTSCVSLSAFIILCVLAAQGVMVLYQRLTSIALVSLIFVTLMLGNSIGLHLNVLIGFYGAIGLLDYIYHYRLKVDA